MGLVHQVSVTVIDILKRVEDGHFGPAQIARKDRFLAHELAQVLLLHDYLVHVALLSGWVTCSLVVVHLRKILNVRIVLCKLVSTTTHFLNKKGVVRRKK